MSLFQQTSLTFGQAKTQVAQQGSKQSTSEFKTRAGQSLQQAIKYWNRYNWKWRLKQATDFSVSASGTGIALPYDFKDVYTVRWEGDNDHYLKAVTRRDYDRQWIDQSLTGFPLGYELFKVGETGRLGLVPPTSQAGTLILKYYSRMTVPCAVTSGTYTVAVGDSAINGDLTGVTIGSRFYTASAMWADGAYVSSITPSLGDTSARMRLNFNASASATGTGVTFTFGGDDEILDIPEDYENGILSWATGHFLSALGAPESRLTYFISQAHDELQEALRENDKQEDLDLAFQSLDEIPIQLINPNATTL